MKKNILQKPKLIHFEGCDGTFKSTISKNYSLHINAFHTYEPNAEIEKCKDLREECLSAKYKHLITDEEREEKLIQSREISLSKIIIPKLNEGITVVSDRGFLSGMVYASVSCKKYNNFSVWWNEFGKRIKILPDEIIYCYNHKSIIEKKSDRIDDIYDNETNDFHNKIRENFELVISWLITNEIIKSPKRFFCDPSLNEQENLKKLIQYLEM